MQSSRFGFKTGLLTAAMGLAALTTTTHAAFGPQVDRNRAVVTRAEVQDYLAQEVPVAEADDAPRAAAVPPRTCGGRGPGVPTGYSFQPGWSSEVVRDGVPGAEALALAPTGQLYVGGRSDDDRRRVVSRLDADGTLADSRTQAEPDALAIDTQGRIWLGSYDIVKTLGPPDAGPDQVRHQIIGGGNIDDLALSSRGERVWVALRDGRVVEVVDHQERPVVPFGEPAVLAVDDSDGLWVARHESKGWWLYRLEGIHPRAWQKIDDFVPDLVSVVELSWGPDGALYLLAEVRQRDPLVIVRWDPKRPDEARTWAAGLSSHGAVGGMAWDNASECLYLSSGDAGKIYRTCPCEAGLSKG